MEKITKNQAISIQVLALVAKGMNAVEALKLVCGSEVVDNMLSELYGKLRAEAK